MRSTLSVRRLFATAGTLSLWSALLLASPVAAVTIDWVNVGNPGNTCDSQLQGCFGDVDYSYQISKLEVTWAQYADFLNAVADIDTFGLYNAGMADFNSGGIIQSGVSGFFAYTPVLGREDWPVTYVSFYDAVRFANWMHNGQPNTGTQTSATTEDGSYTFSGATTVGGRNPGATIVLPTEDEWYKAAYHVLGTTYYDFPTSSDLQTVCAAPGATSNTANCHGTVGNMTDVGAYTESPSFYGTFDQGGNAFEWTEAILGSDRVKRGGARHSGPWLLGADQSRDSSNPTDELDVNGFRLVLVPEPGTGVLVAAGLLVLARRRRRRS